MNNSSPDSSPSLSILSTPQKAGTRTQNNHWIEVVHPGPKGFLEFLNFTVRKNAKNCGMVGQYQKQLAKLQEEESGNTDGVETKRAEVTRETLLLESITCKIRETLDKQELYQWLFPKMQIKESGNTDGVEAKQAEIESPRPNTYQAGVLECITCNIRDTLDMMELYQRLFPETQKEEESGNTDGVEAKRAEIEFSSGSGVESIGGPDNFHHVITMSGRQKQKRRIGRLLDAPPISVGAERYTEDGHIKPNFRQNAIHLGTDSFNVQKASEAVNYLFSRHAKDTLDGVFRNMYGTEEQYKKTLQKEQESGNTDGVEVKRVAIEFSSRMRMESIKGLNNVDHAIIMIRGQDQKRLIYRLLDVPPISVGAERYTEDDHIKPNFRQNAIHLGTGLFSVQKPAEAANLHTLFSQHAKDALVSRNHPAQATKQTTKNAHVRDKDARADIRDRSAAGVEVKFYESPYSRKFLEYVGSDSIIAPFIRDLNPALGLSIAPLKYAGYSGTGGLYLSDGDNMYFLTSRHVVLPGGQADNIPYYCRQSSQGAVQIMLPAPPVFDNIDMSLEEKIQIRKGTVNRYGAQLSQLRRDEESGLDVKAIRAGIELELRNEEANVQKLEDFKSNVINNMREFDDRVIGHVVYAPPFAAVGEGCFIQDLALIKLNRGTIDWSTFKGNVIDLGDTFDYPDDRLLPIKGVVPLDELVNSGEGMTFIKNGVKTGTTIGCGIGMESVEYNIGNTKLLGNMFAIEPVQVGRPFSDYGDSGSIVVDSRGRAAGLLTGGTPKKDKSFVIPIACVLESVKIAFPGMQLYSVPV